MLVQWQPSLELGVPQVDQQHKEIFNRVNAMLTAMQQGKGKQEVGQLIDFLGTYVVTHFTDEERVMSTKGYPHLAAHRELHAAFLADFKELKRELETKGSSTLLVIQVQRRVVSWLIQHIGTEDKKIADFLKAQA